MFSLYKLHYLLHISPTYCTEVIYIMNTKLISDSLQLLGISKCYKGYRQLFLAVELALNDESRLLSVTENIYAPVSDMCRRLLQYRKKYQNRSSACLESQCGKTNRNGRIYAFFIAVGF